MKIDIRRIKYYFWPLPSIEWRRPPVNNLIKLSWLEWQILIDFKATQVTGG